MMGNTFGTSTTAYGLIDPRSLRRNRNRFVRSPIRELQFANSLYVPLGECSARGWVLLPRSEYDAIRGYGTSFQLQVDQFDRDAPALTFKNLSIVQARSVTTGLEESEEAIYLIELTDDRGILANRWFEFPTNSYYNVLSSAYPAAYYSSSLNSGAAWTWSTMIQNLWEQMSLLGTYPGLPSTPNGAPTNWNLAGTSAWKSLCKMLDHIGMAVSCDLTSDSPYGIVAKGAADSTFATYTTTYASRLEDDLEWIDSGSGRVPGTVIVYFRRVNQYYGTEETIRRDSSQWSTAAVYTVSVSAPSTFTGAVGTHYLWDDFAVRFDINGNPLAADIASAAAIATERVSQYFDLIYSRTSGAMDRTYAGVLPFYAGSLVDGVRWYQDFAQGRAGWRTQVIRGDLWREVYA